MTIGGRNLVILGVVSTVIAITTTSVSLLVYHNSGDIYLDRSRPGFLPDEDELEKKEEKKESDYEFNKTGEITKSVLQEYLNELEEEIKELNEISSPFDAKALSDKTFGIPAAE